MDECKGLFGRLFGHKFVAAYNVGPVGHLKTQLMFAEDVAQLMEASKQKTLAVIYCPRCGARQEIKS